MKIEEYINVKDLSERLDGDYDLFKELVDLFLEDTKGLLNKIEHAIKSNDPEQIRKSAHTLKGSVSNFSAKKAYDAALTLENIGKDKTFENIQNSFNILKTEIDNAIEALKMIKNNNRF